MSDTLKITKTSILGALPQATFLSLVVWLLALLFGAILGGPYIFIESQTALVYFLVFSSMFLVMLIWSAVYLVKARLSGKLAQDGPFKYVRHPHYGAIVFLLLPGLALLLRSWLLILVIVPVYFIWRSASKKEEKQVVIIWPEDYKAYRKNVGLFFPKPEKLNSGLFFGSWVLIIFALIFSSFCLR